MSSLIYQCPVTGFKVQGWVAEEVPATDAEDVFLPMTCAACARTHLVNVVTGRVLAYNND
jgi:hypothetical protein